MLNVKFDASLVNSVYSTQIKPTAIIDKKDTLNVVSKMLNNFVIMLFFNCYCFIPPKPRTQCERGKVYLVNMSKNHQSGFKILSNKL